jgi:hypothetical protein
MKRIILAYLTLLLIYAMPSVATATSAATQSLAQQCRTMLETKNPAAQTLYPSTWFLYYHGVSGNVLNKEKAIPAIENLYANALQHEKSQRPLTESERAETPEITASGQMKMAPGALEKIKERETKDKADFCQREIQALQNIVSGETTQLKTGLISSKSGDCLSILKEWCKK